MNGCLSRIAGLRLVALAAGGYHYMRVHRPAFAGNALLSRRAPLTWGGSKHDGTEHFSPAEDLERLELAELLAAAERVRYSSIPLRITMYSFTDRQLAQVLITEGDRGTVVELYREQYEMEERNGGRFRDGSVTSLFRGHQNIHVRVSRHRAVI